MYIQCWARATNRRGYVRNDVFVKWTTVAPKRSKEEKARAKRERKEQRQAQKRLEAQRADSGGATGQGASAEGEKESSASGGGQTMQVVTQERFRYYHLFDEGELATLAREITHCRIIQETLEGENMVIVLQRTEV